MPRRGNVPKREILPDPLYNSILVTKLINGVMLDGHNDHRIVMAMSVVLSRTGGSISGAEAVRKSYPGFFDHIKQLGAKVELS